MTKKRMWALNGASDEARMIVKKAAKAEGIFEGKWVSNLIMAYDGGLPPSKIGGSVTNEEIARLYRVIDELDETMKNFKRAVENKKWWWQ